MSTLFALLLIVHGIAHLVGFVVPWGLMPSADAAGRTTVLGGSLDVGETGMKVLGLVWLALAIGFVTVGVALVAGRYDSGWTARLVALSLVFCVVGWPDSRFGLVANAVIIAALSALMGLGRV